MTIVTWRGIAVTGRQRRTGCVNLTAEQTKYLKLEKKQKKKAEGTIKILQVHKQC